LDTIAIAAQHRPHQRHWRDLSKRRLLLGLALAPVPPIALGALLALLLGGGLFFGTRSVFGALGVILAAAEIWSLPIGTLFLVIARLRGGVRRAHCFLLGAFLACSLPLAASTASNAVDWAFGMASQSATSDDDFEGDFHGPSDSTFVVILGLVLIPFGTLGGWVFWRIGVYPARPKVIDVAPVFD
jgi:hypothetical protein